MKSGSLPYLILAIGLISSSAFAQNPQGWRLPFNCAENLQEQSVVDAAENFRTSFSSDPKQVTARKEVREALEMGLKEAFKDTSVNGDIATLMKDVGDLIDNPIFDEALSKSLAISGIKKLGAIEDFKIKLRTASEKDQVEFARLVVRQYDALLDKAFAWVDEDRFELLAKRWNMSPRSAFRLLNRWEAMKTTNFGEMALGVLVWTKTVDASRIVQEIKNFRKAELQIPLKDVEKITVTRIKSPHSDIQLSLNDGPISDLEFEKKMRYWNLWGWTKHKLNMIRYPNDASFILMLSIVPVATVHALIKDWNLTNTIATIIGGIATCPPLIAKLTRSAVRQSHDAVWLEIMTLKQLSEFNRWIEAHPTRALELGFGELGDAVNKRMDLLRKLRYKELSSE